MRRSFIRGSGRPKNPKFLVDQTGRFCDSPAMPKSEPESEKATLRASGALAGLRVLELAENVAAPYCAKLLADLGADVIKIERSGGDPSRQRGPFPDDRPHPERSALFLYLNTSKRSQVLDLEIEADRVQFQALADESDVLIEDRAPGEPDALGLGFDVLAKRNPGLIVCSVTPFGQSGPNRHFKSQHLNLYHGGGHSSPFAVPTGDRAPARAGGYLGEYDAGLTAAVGALAAVYAREDDGHGQHIDVSKQEAMMCLERVTIGRYANEPDPFGQGGGPGGLLRAKDGWIMLTTLEVHQWEALVSAMGTPAWTQEAWCTDPMQRRQNMERLQQHLETWTSTRSADEIYHLAQAAGTPAAPVRNVAEVLDWPQANARGFFQTLDHPQAGSLRYPTRACDASASDWVGSRAPLLDQHAGETFLPRNPDAHAPAPTADAATSSNAKAPLEGIRIVDFTWAWAGPQGSLLLGMLGAEVIKVESQARLDHARVHSLTGGNFGEDIDGSPVFNDLNLGKRSLRLNLRKEGARELVRKLVAKSDVVLQNMRPGVLDRMGLGYEALSTINPQLVMASSSAVGATGPEKSYAGYAPTFACLSGIANISGHPDLPPIALSGSVDLRVGTASAFEVLVALIHRKRGGSGQNLDISSTEVITSMIGEALVGYELSGRIPERIGNRDDWMAPHGCYSTAIKGTWVSIAVQDDDEWEALRGLLDDPGLDATEFATRELRFANQDALDERVSAWTLRQEPDAAVSILQAAGISAARVHTGASLAHDAHLAAREVYTSVNHPRLGNTLVVRPPWRMRGAEIRGPAPLLGQHSTEILGEVLGMAPEEVTRLEDEKIVY
jgi:crotonobetainyl-CoA:carnitine CoA-transferase CaiB-like acyl-CoA transferase